MINQPLYDRNGVLLKVGDKVRVQETAGIYGQTRTFIARLETAVCTRMRCWLDARIIEGAWTVYGRYGNSYYEPGKLAQVHLKTKEVGDQLWCLHTNHDPEHGHDTFIEVI